MRVAGFFLACSTAFFASKALTAEPNTGTLAGIVTFKGTPPKLKPFDLAKEPACAQMHATDPLMNETVVTGPGSGLANVVVYISAGEQNTPAAPATALAFDQQSCHYATHVLAVQVGQEIKIINSDPVSHDIHPAAKMNRDWSRIQPPRTPPFSYSYEKEEFIPVKCNMHPWMQGYFVVLKTHHFAVTGANGVYRLPDLPPGKYTVTAWHESLGTLSQEVTVTGGETTSLYFAFSAKP